MATTPNYGWITPAPTDFVVDLPADFETFADAADATVKALNPGTTAGDLDYYTSGTAKARIGIGTTGQVLTVSAGVPAWASPASGSLTQLATQNMAGLNTVTFSSINQGYRALVIQGTGLYLGSAVEVRLRWNNISTAVYDYTGLGTNSGTGQNNLDVTYVTLGDTATSTASTHNFWAEIVNYNVNNQLKLVRGLYSQPPDSRIRMFVATGASSGSAVEDAITEINISTTTNFTAGTITLYGMS